jgi:DNA-binding NarL/FixJ family response regulator
MPKGLVCDDDAVSRRVASAVLEEAGVEVVGECETAYDLVQLARVSKPEIVVLDVALRGPTGLEVLPELHGTAPDAAVVIHSSFTEPSMATRPGVRAVVQKGDSQALSAAVRSVLDL